MDDLLEALNIFRRYKNSNYPTHCEHEIMLIMNIEKGEVSKEHEKQLDDLQFFWSDEHDCWASLKFGSA